MGNMAGVLTVDAMKFYCAKFSRSNFFMFSSHKDMLRDRLQHFENFLWFILEINLGKHVFMVI